MGEDSATHCNWIEAQVINIDGKGLVCNTRARFHTYPRVGDVIAVGDLAYEVLQVVLVPQFETTPGAADVYVTQLGPMTEFVKRLHEKHVITR